MNRLNYYEIKPYLTLGANHAIKLHTIFGNCNGWAVIHLLAYIVNESFQKIKKRCPNILELACKRNYMVPFVGLDWFIILLYEIWILFYFKCFHTMHESFYCSYCTGNSIWKTCITTEQTLGDFSTFVQKQSNYNVHLKYFRR